MPLRISPTLLACAAACILALAPAGAAAQAETPAPAATAPPSREETDFLALLRLVIEEIPPPSAERALLVDVASLEAAAVLFAGRPVDRSRIMEAVGPEARERPGGGVGAPGALRGSEHAAHTVRLEGLVNLLGRAEATVHMVSTTTRGPHAGSDFRIFRVDFERRGYRWEKVRSSVLIES